MPNEQDAEQSAKNVAFYSAVVEAWVATRMEKDRTLLSLATGGIGLLATLLTTVGPSSRVELWLYGAAGVCFITTVVGAIRVFDRNSEHLSDVLRKKTVGDDADLQLLDRVVSYRLCSGWC
jgi:hypothetical protein